MYAVGENVERIQKRCVGTCPVSGDSFRRKPVTTCQYIDPHCTEILGQEAIKLASIQPTLLLCHLSFTTCDARQHVAS